MSCLNLDCHTARNSGFGRKWQRPLSLLAAALLASHSHSIAQTPESAGSKNEPDEVKQAMQVPEGDARVQALRAALLAWEQKEPVAMIEWLCAAPKGSPQSGVLREASMDWGDRDHMAAIAWALKHDLKQPCPESIVFHLAIGQWARKDGKAAAEWADKQPKGNIRTIAYFSVAGGWASSTATEAAAAWAAKVPDADDRHAALGRVAQAYSFKASAEAAAWAEKLPADDVKVIAGIIAGNWGRKDAAKAVQWVNSLQLSPAEKDDILNRAKLK